MPRRPPNDPVSVVVPTIGRVEMLDRALRSIGACDPGPAEIVVVDQSGGGAVGGLARALADGRIRVVRCDGRGIALATNRGLAAAQCPTVLVTHDDCTVTPDWVGVAWRLACEAPTAILTGRVLPGGDGELVPSTIVHAERRDWSGEVTAGVLYPANMVLPRDEVLAIGGFDERPGLRLAAEDNDLCYRWLVAGRPLRYEPDLVVTHHDWRDPEALVRANVTYARGQGAFYAKHLYARDARIVRFVARDLRRGARATVAGLLRRRQRWTDPYREMLVWLPIGIVAGLRESRRLSRDGHS